MRSFPPSSKKIRKYDFLQMEVGVGGRVQETVVNNQAAKLYQTFSWCNPVYIKPTTENWTSGLLQPYLWNVNSGPEELQMFTHLLRLILGVQDAQLCEHPHVSALQTCQHTQPQHVIHSISHVKICDASTVLQTSLSILYIKTRTSHFQYCFKKIQF